MFQNLQQNKMEKYFGYSTLISLCTKGALSVVAYLAYSDFFSSGLPLFASRMAAPAMEGDTDNKRSVQFTSL